MKEHKNPKVLSEGILWMVSAVDDFGVSHLKLKVCYLFIFLVIAAMLSVIACILNTSIFIFGYKNFYVLMQVLFCRI